MAGHGSFHRSTARAAVFLAIAALIGGGCDQSRTIVYSFDAQRDAELDGGSPDWFDAGPWDSGWHPDAGVDLDGGRHPDGSR